LPLHPGHSCCTSASHRLPFTLGMQK
jgi:hypothetical protein